MAETLTKALPFVEDLEEQDSEHLLNMKRINSQVRENWEQKLEDLGFGFHSLDTPYWEEAAYYSFPKQEISLLEEATVTLWDMVLQAVDYVISHREYYKFHIPEWFHHYVEKSWEEEWPSVYARFDFAFDGKNLKMLECNADTPTSLYEAAVIQWYWLKDKFPEKDQFNSIHEKLISTWEGLKPYISEGHIYFAGMSNIEDVTTLEYLRDTATQAGLTTDFLPIENIGWAEEIKMFVDEENILIDTVFKLYPYEWLVQELFGKNIPMSETRWIEPAWKIIASSKALLPYLWKLFPGHPFLLPSYFEQRDLMSFVKKPFYSREGANVSLFKNNQLITSMPGVYGAEGYIYQDLVEINPMDGKYPVIGSWVIGQESAGIGIRESIEPITGNTSRFVPHIIE